MAFDSKQLTASRVSFEEKKRLMRLYGDKTSESRAMQAFEARCSIPIQFAGEDFGVLAMQGTECMLKHPESLQEIASVAAGLLWLHKRVERLATVEKFKSKLLRWFGHDATKPLVLLRDGYLEKLNLIKWSGERIEEAKHVLADAGVLIDFITANFVAYGFVGGEHTDWAKGPTVPNVQDVIEDVLKVVKADAGDVVFDLQAVSGDTQCELDYLKMVAILYNLIDNAVKATRKVQGDRIVVLKAERNHDVLTLSVVDNGTGFPDDMLTVLNEGTLPQGDGHFGYGLEIVLGFTKLLGGKVTFSTTEEGGAHVCVQLPLPPLTSEGAEL